jgi:hypothetical protein
MMPWRRKLSRRSFIYAAAGAGLGLAGLSATSGNAAQAGREPGILLPEPALAGTMFNQSASRRLTEATAWWLLSFERPYNKAVYLR